MYNRKLFLKIFYISFLLFISSLIIGCDNLILKNYEFTFINKSDYIITITPDNQDWDEFVLNPGESKIIKISTDTIKYWYNNATFVEPENLENGIIVFFNKTLLKISNYSSVNLILVKWNGTYFGEDYIWCEILSKYTYGLKAYTGSDLKEVNPGVDNISFYFTNSYIQYKTNDIITINLHEQWHYIFYDSTTITQKSKLIKNSKFKKVIFINLDNYK